MKWFGLFALLLSACAQSTYILPMEYRQDGSKKPIVFGSLAGLPQEYFLVLHLDFKKPGGKIVKTTREFGLPKKSDTSGITHFAYTLPSGEWTVRGLEIGAIKEYKVPGIMGKVTKSMFANLKCLDTSTTIFRFTTETGKLHYLGRWEFGGFAELEKEAALKMEDFRRAKDPVDLKSEAFATPTLAIGNHLDEDRTSFDRANGAFSRKQSVPSLPEVSWPRADYRFAVTVGEVREGGGYHHHMNWSHQQMMKPNIPKF